jgi:hypothetical protein
LDHPSDGSYTSNHVASAEEQALDWDRGFVAGDSAAADEDDGCGGADNRYLFLLNVSRKPLGRAVPVLCIRPRRGRHLVRVIARIFFEKVKKN